MTRTAEEIRQEIARWKQIRESQLDVLESLARGGQHFEEREGDAYTGLTRMKAKEATDVISIAEKKIKDLQEELAEITGAKKKSSRVMWGSGS